MLNSLLQYDASTRRELASWFCDKWKRLNAILVRISFDATTNSMHNTAFRSLNCPKIRCSTHLPNFLWQISCAKCCICKQICRKFRRANGSKRRLFLSYAKNPTKTLRSLSAGSAVYCSRFIIYRADSYLRPPPPPHTQFLNPYAYVTTALYTE